ncbi:helix-turn-helix domain-containing protein [Microbacterium murale]|uniref:Cyclic diguanylate phosphodiesterase n=1 Tax=Microbacterium murale TaxID=1081040 RepID=A0ABQ1R8Z7_9MICO|nr:helix-turn-helix domain-containing protein [Microbacterium murale]GGD62590.1 cyclic diguanylate phosphodiesterase [Microbacterium murale]
MAGSELTASELAREVLAASRAEPGQSDAGVGGILERSGMSASDAGEVIASVRESQLLNARLRRRAAEVEALFSTARELVRLQDVDDVLKRLVERAHELMGTDVTYLSEVENDAGDLRVRHSAGTVTPEFRDLLVPAGFGLASKVASTREPAWVARYQQMSETPHDPRIDAAVEAEGLVSFLGVPLAVGDEVLGALFACNRFGYEYTPEEILLLSAFADHAAAVLHTARALAERAAATARAEEAYRELERHLAATERASGIHEELTSAVMSGATVVDLVSTVARRLERKVWALDEDGRALHRDGTLPPRRAIRDAMEASQASGHAESFEARGSHWILVAILGADRIVGAIIAEGSGSKGSGDIDDVDQRTLERAGHVAALVSFKREAASALRAERRARWLLKVIDDGDSDSASDDGVEFSAPIIGCAVIDLRDRDVADAASMAAAAVAEDGFVAHRDHRLIIAWTTGDAVAQSERVRRILADRLREQALTAVARSPVTGTAGLAGAVERATADLGFLPALGIEATTVSSDLFAPYHSLAAADPESATRFVGDLLGAVLSWDERRGTALFETLACFFDSGESRQAVAEKMHIHKNTVQQRLQRVHALLQGEWDDSEFRFRVQAAVRLESLRRVIRDARTPSSSG